MKRRTLIAALAFLTFFAVVATAKAQITTSITLKDSSNNNITSTVVPINTVVYIYCTYTDSGGVSATASLTVSFNGGPAQTILTPQTVTSGTTTTATYTAAQIGEYTFIWDCTKQTTSESSSNADCPQERSLLQAVLDTDPENKVPEPAPIAGLALGGLALGLFMVRKKRGLGIN